MGHNVLSKFAVVCVFAAITFASYCFGKYVIGGKIANRQQSVEQHIPGEYGAATGSSSGDSDSSPGAQNGVVSSPAESSPGQQPDVVIRLSGDPRQRTKQVSPPETTPAESDSDRTPPKPVEATEVEATKVEATKPKSVTTKKVDDSRAVSAHRFIATTAKVDASARPKPTSTSSNTSKHPVSPGEPRTQPRVESTSASDSPTTYRVVVGSFQSKDNSALMASELQKKGYYTFTAKQIVKGKPVYRVQVGAFSESERAEQVRRELESQGYTARVSNR
ncbi:MAG: hypothetical protein AUJ92_04745 [Armatimonadetes bacterium CG2_30_59_28]|nr:hypothetical protein [Armatimonadota bacterium]OIO96940.1 MAG: hypothetical protein AUJ92_04745 [Armatimonadetes bacterium CG2_30_59_28]PIU65015.1 MAG: hypothetical protein COS85_10335 [Armatimonadetes bacterium CG07_land_8_20_14_0_80_59_28]PIX38563.1 MAG: hypothetical protein COZ56_20120 [Armatimonadetes bacterium CG_4_8_14_3_um_filter_58_9]PIY40357.1 MAG: hypothetical protein COZ05_17645 [Armatimonadetes bacterium CG_4_10_14_3_um_filter_59_10]PJB78284.1 MAG: hypothetical protein CO095_006